MAHLSDRTLADCFAAIERAAVAGERCPINGTMGVDTNLVSALARAGKVRVEVYALNWRTVEILTGPLAGKRTAKNPRGGRPYLIVDQHGSSRAITVARQQPSPPRMLRS